MLTARFFAKICEKAATACAYAKNFCRIFCNVFYMRCVQKFCNFEKIFILCTRDGPTARDFVKIFSIFRARDER